MGGIAWTIGHSGHPSDRLVELLRASDIDVVIDVRSAPYSRVHPQHRKDPLSDAVRDAGMTYRFYGQRLGGRPDEIALYDVDGHVRYDAVSRTEPFRRGIAEVVQLIGTARVCLLCAEEDPTCCHRRLLVGRVLRDHDVEVRHIRGDGTVVDDAALGEQLTLFDDWRSAAPVPLPRP